MKLRENLDKRQMTVSYTRFRLNVGILLSAITVFSGKAGIVEPLTLTDSLAKRKPIGPPPSAPQFPFDASTARNYQRACADWLALPLNWTNDLGLAFVLIPPGTFQMGSPESEPGHNAGGFDETRHSVTLTRPFYVSRHEVTVAQFRAFVEDSKYITDIEKNGGGHAHDETAEWKHRAGTNWRQPGFAGAFTLADNHPVVHVSHTDSRQFCRWLQERSAVEGLIFDLPTEVQWEWACRAGAATLYWWGFAEDATGKVANVGDRSLKKVHPKWPRSIMPMDDKHAFLAPVGSYDANGFGLHDMLGNVWEFCSTHYGPYPRQAVTDPDGGDPKRGYAVRGGGWSNIASDVRCASRNADPPHFGHSNLGFRVAVQLSTR
jgi:sulfatase modifying factor 1